MGFRVKLSLFRRITQYLMRIVDEPRDLPLSDVSRVAKEIQPGDVVLVEGRSRASHVIRFITQSPWSHAAIYIGRPIDYKKTPLYDKIMDHYHGDPNDQVLIEAMMGQGVIVSPVQVYEQDHIRVCRPSYLHRHDIEKVVGYCVAHLGVEYNARQLLDLARFLLPWTLFPRRWRSTLFRYNSGENTRLTCAYLLAEAFYQIRYPILPSVIQNETIGIELIRRNPKLFTPSDFDYSPFFEIVKYPIIDMQKPGDYQYLPWNEDGLISNDKLK